jgi:hypothetical protein
MCSSAQRMQLEIQTKESLTRDEEGYAINGLIGYSQHVHRNL